MAGKTFALSLVTPEGAAFEGEVEFATGPGFFKVEQDRALALVDDAVEARHIDADRAQEQLETAREELERIERGESEADRWQLEQRIRHAENQLTVVGGGSDYDRSDGRPIVGTPA